MDRDVSEQPGFKAEVKVGNKVVFRNWADVKGVPALQRSSQPYYDGHDTKQNIDDAVVGLFNKNKTKLVVSLNEYKLEGSSLERLKKEKIDYEHIIVKDFKSPSVSALSQACRKIAEVIKAGGHASVYCGYGAGRTGTMVTAYQIYSKIHNGGCSVNEKDELIRASTAESSHNGVSTGQKEVLEKFYTEEVKHKKVSSPAV